MIAASKNARLLKGRTVGRKRAEPDESSYAGRLAARLGSLRAAAGYTGKELAAKLGVPASTYYTYEAGTVDVPLNLLPKIARALRIAVADLMPAK